MTNDSIERDLTAGIYIEAKPAIDPFGAFGYHSYLTYRDGKGSTEVIRGGPDTMLAEDVKIVVQAGIPLEQSKDAYEPGETPASRGAKQIDLGTREPKEVWQAMVESARKISCKNRMSMIKIII
ncbi:hypothetical protein JCM17960_17030 [Magnetospira thiophila]